MRVLIVSNKENNHIEFHTNNTERLRIDSSGRVLISGQAALTSTSLTHSLQVACSSDADGIAIIGRADDIGEISFYEADKTTNLGEIQYPSGSCQFQASCWRHPFCHWWYNRKTSYRF